MAKLGPAMRAAREYDPKANGARCDLCPLAGKPVVPPTAPEGGKTPRLVIVGEGPGVVEESWLQGFIGPTGKYLNSLIQDCQQGITTGSPIVREETHITNSMLCYSPNEAEHEVAAACCAPRLLRELSEIPKEVPILALGKAAARSILGVRSIQLARGFVWHTKKVAPEAIRAAQREAGRPSALEKTDKTGMLRAYAMELKAQILAGRGAIARRVVLPTLHPAFVMRLETWQPVLQIDMNRAFRVARGEAVRLRDRGQYRVISRVKTLFEEQGKIGTSVVTDVETDGPDPMTCNLVCVGISDGVRTVVLHPGGGKIRGKRWRDEYGPALQWFFEQCGEVVMHNGYNFDQIVLRRHGVKFDKVNLEDSLLAHHAYASHLPKRLDQVVSEYVDARPWKVVHGRRGGVDEKGLLPHQMPPEEVCRYNGKDVILTSLAWQAMQGDLASERAVYEHDKEISRICQQMTIDGIYMNPDRREEVGKAMAVKSAALLARMRKVVRDPSFDPMKPNHVRWALFQKLKAPIFEPTPTGLPSTSAATLEHLATTDTAAGKLAKLLVDWRVVVKIKGTYLDAIEINPATGRVHYTWRPYGTVNGRWASRFQSLPRKGPNPEDQVGSCYEAPAGWVYEYFDLSQSEMRGAAMASADPNFIAVCGKGDVHAGNASVLFPDAAKAGWLAGGPPCERCKAEEKMREAGRPEEEIGSHGVGICSCPKGNYNLGKKFRDIAKNAGFGILYSAEIDTIYAFLRAHGFDVSKAAVEAMFALIHERYSRYYEYCEENLYSVRQVGHMRTALVKRIRWMGFHPKPGDVYNFPIQTLIADLMNLRIIELRRRLPKRTRILMQGHDAVLMESPEGKNHRIAMSVVRELWEEPVELPNGQVFVMPIDLKDGERLSNFR